MQTTRIKHRTKKQCKADWLAWARSYGMDKFYDAFLRYAQGARGYCIHCKQPIYLDIVEGCGVPDWKTADDDYGCDRSPDTTSEGVGSHMPETI